MPITYTPGSEPKALPVLPEIPDDGSAYVIRLNRGLYTIIDIADVLLTHGWQFSAGNPHGNNWTVFAYRPCDAAGNRDRSYLHTLITGYSVTDHVNGNTFDNRRLNLREATRSQNNHNTRLLPNNSSGFKGVCWDRQHAKWRAKIMIDNSLKHLGLFPADDDGVYTINGQNYDRGLIDAALAYDMAAREHHKSFATLNFPIASERSALTGELRPMITT